MHVRDQRFTGLREPNQNQKAEFRDLLEWNELETVSVYSRVSFVIDRVSLC